MGESDFLGRRGGFFGLVRRLFLLADQALGRLADRLFGGLVRVVDCLLGVFCGLAQQLLRAFSACSQPARVINDNASNDAAMDL